MLNDSIKVKGALSISKNGVVVQEVPNLVVSVGKTLIAARLAGSGSVLTHMAVGSGSTAAAVGDTILGAEMDRNALTVSGGSAAGATVTYTTTWAAGDGTGAIKEAGLFTAASGGTMLARTVFPVVNKGADDVITITWEVTIL
jgi:hypothetical protein